MAKKFLFGLLVIVFVSAPVLPQQTAYAQGSAEIYATPAAVMPGGVVTFAGFGFTPDSTVDLYIETIPSQFLGTLPTDPLGKISGTLPIPAVSPGENKIMASPIDVFTTLTVLPEMTLDLAPNGGLPVPQGLTGLAQPGDSSVFLEWLPVEHSSVKGYRIYRSADGRTFEPVGSTFIPAFVDLSAALGSSYQYRVTAYAEDGFESDLSDAILTEIGLLYPIFLPVIQR